MLPEDPHDDALAPTLPPESLSDSRRSTADRARVAPGAIARPPSAAAQQAPAPRTTRALVDDPTPAPDDLLPNNVKSETRRTCPRCGTLNPVSFTFCGSCGLNLEGEGTGAGYSMVPDSPEVNALRNAGPPEQAPIARLTLMRPDGSEGDVYVAQGAHVTLGRTSGKPFDADPYLSPQHIIFRYDGKNLSVEDAGSLNGVFLRIQQHPLEDGDVFRVGQELLRFNLISGERADEHGTQIAGSPNPGFWGRLSMVEGLHHDGSAFPLFGDETILGRERGEILFFDDGYVSGTHAKITYNGDDTVDLVDLQSSNGTYIKLKAPRVIAYGSMLVLGQQLFRIDAP